MDDVVWTPRAGQDLDDIAAYIAFDNPDAAARTAQRLVEAAAGLGFFPFIGRAGRVAGTRELVVTGSPYIIAYRVRETVEVLAIIHTSRDWPGSFD